MPTIYHGTPLTPRAALLAIMPGRAGCVSFANPQDVSAIEEACLQIMYDNGAFSFWQAAIRAGKEWAEDRDWTPFLPLGRAAIGGRALGCHPGYARCAVPAQRRANFRLALWAVGRSALAHGRATSTSRQVMRAFRPGLPWLDRDRKGCGSRVRRLLRSHGRSGGISGQRLARPSHDARHVGCAGLSLHQRGQHIAGAERVAL